MSDDVTHTTDDQVGQIPIVKNAGLFACIGVILLAIATWVGAPLVVTVLTIVACVVAVAGIALGFHERVKISFH